MKTEGESGTAREQQEQGGRGRKGQDVLADVAEGAEDGVQIVVGEREVEVADVDGGFGGDEAAAAMAGVGGSAGGQRRASTGVVVVVAAADAQRGRARGHGALDSAPGTTKPLASRDSPVRWFCVTQVA